MGVGLHWAVLVPVHGQQTDSHITCTSGVMVVASVALGWGSIYASQRRWAIVRLIDHKWPDNGSLMWRTAFAIPVHKSGEKVGISITP